MSKSKRDRFKKEDDGMGGDYADDLKHLHEAYGPGEDEDPEPAEDRQEEPEDPDLREIEGMIPVKKIRGPGGKKNTRGTAPEDIDDGIVEDPYGYEDGEEDSLYEEE